MIPLPCWSLSVDSGYAPPWGQSNSCDIISWSDSTGQMRTAALVRANGVYSNKYIGGFLSQLVYKNGIGGTINTIEPWNTALSGLGPLVNHYTTTNSRNWVQSKTEGYEATNSWVLLGANHCIRRIQFHEDVDQEHPEKGSWLVTLDYMFRTGDDYFMYAITYDTTGLADKTVDHDSRSPYCEYVWDGSYNFLNGISGFQYGRDKRFDCPSVAAGAWTYTNANTIPFVWEWKTYPDAEIGYIQTQSQSQHPGGKEVEHGDSGTSLPPYWQLGYQMNGSPYSNYNYTTQKITWGMPYHSITGGFGAPDGYQGYSLCIVLDPTTRGGVPRVLAEQELIHNGSVALTASEGSVVTQGLYGVGCPLIRPYDPPGFDHVYRTWRVGASPSNVVECAMTIVTGTLKNATFLIEDYRGAAAPEQVALDGTNLVADTGYFASVDDENNKLYLTLNHTLGATNSLTTNTLYIRGHYETNIPGLVTNLLADNSHPGTNVLAWSDETLVTGEWYSIYGSTSAITTITGTTLLVSGIAEGVGFYRDVITRSGAHYYAIVAESEYRVSNEQIVPGWNATTNNAENTDNTPPGTPENFILSGTAARARLSWSAPDDPDLSGYRVYRGYTASSLSVYTNLGVITAFTNRFLVHGQAYYYALAALDDETPPNISALTTTLSYRVAAPADYMIYDGEPDGRPFNPSTAGAWNSRFFETNTAPAHGDNHLVFAAGTGTVYIGSGSAWWAWNGWQDVDASDYDWLKIQVRLAAPASNLFRVMFGREDTNRLQSTRVTVTPAYLDVLSTNYQEAVIPLSAFHETNAPVPYDFSEVNQIVFFDQNGTGPVTYYMDDVVFSAFPRASTNDPFIRSTTCQPDHVNESNTVTEIQLLATVGDTNDDIAAVTADLSTAGGDASVLLKDDGINDDGAISNSVYGMRFSLSVGASSIPGDKAIRVIAIDEAEHGAHAFTTVTVQRVSQPDAVVLYDGETGSRPLASGNHWEENASLYETNIAPQEGLEHLVVHFSTGGGKAGYGFFPDWHDMDAALQEYLEFDLRLATMTANNLHVYVARFEDEQSMPVAVSTDYVAGVTTVYQQVSIPLRDFAATNGIDSYDFSFVNQVVFTDTNTAEYYIDNIRFYAPALADTDGDGLPDVAETDDGVFINGYTAGTSPTNTDWDGDGMRDGDEVWSGTNPTDPLSYLRNTEVTQTVDGAMVEWSSVSGRAYRVWSTSMLTNTWNIRATVTVETATASWTDTNHPVEKIFYRVSTP